MNDRHDIDALRARLEGTRGREYWRSLEAVAETPEFKEFLHREFPQNASEWLDPVGPPRLPEADGRLAGARRRQRLHAPAGRRARAVRAPAGGARPRQAAVLRDGDADERRRHRAARREPRRPADEDRRQPGSPVEPRRHRRVRAGGDPRSLRPGSLADAHAISARFGRSARSSAAMRRRRSSAQQAAQGAGLRILTETVASPTLAAQITELLAQLPAGEVDPVGAGRPPQRPRRQPRWRSANTSTRSTRSRRPTSSCRSTPTSCAPAPPASSTRARLRRAAASKATARSRTGSTRSRARRPTPARKADHRLPLRASEIEAFARAARGAARRRRRRRGHGARGRRRAGSRRSSSDLQAARGQQPRHCRRRPAADRPRARARDERRARQRRRDGRLHADGRSAADEPARRPARAGRRDERRHGRVPADPRRQPGLHRARRICNFADAMEKVPLRAHLGLYEDETVGALPLAHPGSALPRGLERRPRRRRHRDDHPAADRAALQRQVGARSDRGARRCGERSGYDLVREYLVAARRAVDAGAAAPPPPRRAGRRSGAGRRSRRRRRRAAPAPPRPAGAARRRRLPRHRSRRCRRSIANGASGCTTASIPNTAFAPRTVAVQAQRRRAAPAGAAAGAGSRSRLPARSERLRRPLREQRLAAGAAEAADEADLGQRRAHLAGHRRAPGA